MAVLRRFRPALLVCVLIVTGACASWNRDPAAKYSPEQLREMGEKFLASGSHGQALKFLTLAEEKSPKDPKIQHALARAYEERGIPAKALEHYQKALALKPDYPEAHNSLGVFYAKQNQIFLAEEEFKKAIADPFYQTPHLAFFNLGLLYEGKGEIEMALKQYQEAARLSPRYGMAYYRMGLVYEDLQRADDARAAYAMALEYDPGLVEAHFRFGVMSYTAGELENALYSLSQVTKLAPYSSLAQEARLYLNRLKGIVGSQGGTSSQQYGTPSSTEFEVMAGKDVKPRQAVPMTKFRIPPELQRPAPPLDTQQQGVSAESAIPAQPERPPESQVSEEQRPETRAEPQREKEMESAAPASPDSPSVDKQIVIPVATPEEAPPVPNRPPPPQPVTPTDAATQMQRTDNGGEGNLNAVPEQADAPTEKKTQESESASTKGSTPEAGSTYIVQVGSFLDKHNAVRLHERLAERGYDALIKALGHQVLGTVYVVQLKPMEDEEKAGACMKEIEETEGLKPILIKVKQGDE